ncbi:MAG TPA: autotransporter [Erysipelotrichaceae bacterium]|nr:autotransporter [Erysipelotrichaceae bacterium]
MDLSKLFNLQFMMFAEMAAGYILCKIHILKPSDRSVLSKSVINLFLPASIIGAFNIELTSEILGDFAEILIVSTAIQVFCVILAAVLFNRTDDNKKRILQYATVCSNAGFLGNAVAEGVYGQIGMMYGQIYLIPLRIVMFSAGVSYFEGGQDFKTVIKKIITHPCIIAVVIGLARIGFRIPFPTMVTDTLTSLGRCATPLVMVFLGMILAENGFSTMMTKLNIEFSVLRLVLIPAAVLAGCLLAHIDPMITGLSVLLAAMPAGSTTAVFAEQYHADVRFAADCVVLSTILSIAVLPVWAWILSGL